MRSPEERLGELVEAEARGVGMKFVLFWNERPSSWGPGPGCLSQFWPAPFTVDGVTYGTAEHWMMAQKARLFDDGATLMEILKAKTPQAAKSLGRAVRGFSEDRWGAARYRIVVEGNLAKFSHHDGLRRYLVSTGNRVLVEASPVDRPVCPCPGVRLAPTSRDQRELLAECRSRVPCSLGGRRGPQRCVTPRPSGSESQPAAQEPAVLPSSRR